LTLRLGHRLFQFFVLFHGHHVFFFICQQCRSGSNALAVSSGSLAGVSARGICFPWVPWQPFSGCFGSVSRRTSRQRWREKRGIGVKVRRVGIIGDSRPGCCTTGGFRMIPARCSTMSVVRMTKVVSTLCKNGDATTFRAIAASIVRNSRFISAKVRFTRLGLNLTEPGGYGNGKMGSFKFFRFISIE